MSFVYLNAINEVISMVAILEVAIYWLLWFLAYVVCYATGELILWAATLGRRRPRLIRRKDETASRASLLEELSFYVGAAFWIVSIGLLVAFVF